MARSDVLVRMRADTQGYDANINKARRQLDQFKKDNLSMGGVMKQLNGSLLATAARFTSITAAVSALGAALRSNIETAKGFEKSMSQLSSLTGMVGDDLKKLKGYAIELGSTTTLTASQVADAFKMIGSQQPQLLASGEALKAVTKNAITLAEAAGIQLSDAAKTLSVSINQMGGNSENAARYINVLAAAAQKGAGDIVWLGEAITKSGTTAKAVGTDYEELVSNLEQLAKAGYDASTAGTALRSIIMNLEKKASNEFKPSIVGLTQAFENLGKANLSIVEYQDLTGKLFAAQAKALAEAAGEAKKMQDAITGTNIAEEQAKTNTDNLDGSLKSLASAWEGLNLHINDSNGFLRTCVDWLKDVVKWADQAFTAAGRAQKKLAELQGGGDGQPTKVQSQLNALSDSSDKETTYNQIINDYDKLIDLYTGAVNSYKDSPSSINTILQELRKSTGTKFNSIWGVQDTIVALEQMKQMFISSAKNIISPSAPLDVNVNTEVNTSDLSDNKKTNNKPTKYKLTGEQFSESFGIGYYSYLDNDYGISRLSNKATDYRNAGYQMDINNVPIITEASFVDDEAWQEQLDFLAEMKKRTDEEAEAMKKLAEEQEESAKKLRESWNLVASSVSTVGGALSSLEDPTAKVAGTLMQAIATLAIGYAEASEKAAKLGPIAWIAFAATGLATFLTASQSIKKATAGSFATGGVVPGNSFSGDNQIIAADAGELILTRAMQGNIASALQGSERNINLSATISGEQIILATRNTLQRQGRGEYITSRR